MELQELFAARKAVTMRITELNTASSYYKTKLELLQQEAKALETLIMNVIEKAEPQETPSL